MTTLYLVRHGETFDNVRQVLQGQMPGELNETGIKQAEKVRDEMKDVHLDAIIASDLRRSVQTASIIAEPHGGEYELEPLLRERDFGIHTGGPYIKISHSLDPSAETMEQLAQRAADFLNKLTPAPSQEEATILAISHGLFLRVLQAVYHGVNVRAVEKMENAEFRILPLSADMHFEPILVEETGGTAN